MPTPVIPLAADPENETLASALNNFILNFYGAIAKTVVNGEVVWVLPCDLSTGIPGYPRDPSMGTACYFKSIFESFGSQITDAEAAALAAEAAATNAVAVAAAAEIAAAAAQATANAAASDIAALGTMSAQDSDSVSISGGLITGATVTGLPAPSSATDAVTKQYADSLSGGIIPQAAVTLASTGNLSLTGEQTIDGTLTSTTRILVKNQSAPAENGIYVTAAGGWSRASDANTAAELAVNQYYFVSNGTLNAGTGWFISTEPTTLGTDPVVFAQFSAASTYTAGTGLTLIGTQFAISTPIDETLGGTGQAGYATGDILYALNYTTLSRLSVGTAGQVLHVSSGNPAWTSALSIASLALSTPLPGTSGGTGNAFAQFSGPAVTLKTFVLPNYNADILTSASGIVSNHVVYGSGAPSAVKSDGDFTYNDVAKALTVPNIYAALTGTVGATTPLAGAFTTLSATASADTIIGIETGTGDGRGVVSAVVSANGNAGFTWRTNSVNRWTMDTAGTSDSESVRIRKLGTGAGTVATFSSTGLAVTGKTSTTTGFVTNGPIPTNQTSSITVDQLSSTVSRILAWGPNTSTPGQLQIGTISSNASAGANPVATFASTGLAVTGAISASGNIQVGVNLGFNGGVNEAIAYSASAIKTYIGGNPITAVSSTGLSVTGALSATGTSSATTGSFANVTASSSLTVGTGAGASTRTLVLNGGSNTNTGSYVDFQQSSGSSSKIGVDGPITGNSVSDLALWANTTKNINFYVNGSFTRVGQFNTSGLAVSGGISVSTNTNLRTTKGNFNQAVNVKDYGATGDGVTNDTAAIAAAVSALSATNAYLEFPAGTYLTDDITITGKTGLTVVGQGYGNTTVKGRTGNRVFVINTSTNITVRGLTIDGGCTTRTAGQQAVIIDGSNILFTQNRIINSGEYACMFGGNAQSTNVQVIGNYIGYNYADGINFQYVTRGVISDNIIEGVDDDCIAVGYNGSGSASSIVVSNNRCSARNDLGTTTGRGIAIIGASDCIVTNNYITGIKQYGLYVAKEAAPGRVARCQFIGNTVHASCISSGHSIAAFGTSDCSFIDNCVTNPITGNLFEIADWEHLTIQGGTLTQQSNLFARGIHCDESSGWSTTTWYNLVIRDVTIRLEGAATNSGIYLVPNAANTMSSGAVIGTSVRQLVAGDYITIDSARCSVLWKVVNNTDLKGSRTINVSTGGIFTVTNNN